MEAAMPRLNSLVLMERMIGSPFIILGRAYNTLELVLYRV